MATTRPWLSPTVLPGFGLTLGFAGTFLTLIVLIPIAALVLKAASLPLDEFWRIATEPRALASYRLTFGASLLAATINAVFGLVVAWSLVRYRFPARRFIDAIIDLPFALPTAVSGIALATVFAPQGWVGQWLAAIGINIAYTWVGVVVALTLSHIMARRTGAEMMRTGNGALLSQVSMYIAGVWVSALIALALAVLAFS